MTASTSHPPLQDLQLLLLGTGTSSSLPSIGCLTNPLSGCWCCRSTLLKTDPRYQTEYRKNERRNTSAILRIPTQPQPDGRTEKTVLIDCGKSFFSGALEWWPKKGLREIDALLLTHAHADAILGLDDLRGWTLRGHIQKSIAIYCTQDTFNDVSKAFPYLTNMGQATGGGDIPALTWNIIDPVAPFELFGIQVLPLPVEHGKFFTTPPKPFLCSGFLFNRQICYLSDVSAVPSSVYSTLSQYVDLPTSPSITGISSNGDSNEVEKEKEVEKPKLQVLIVDCLRLEEFTSHYGLGKAVETMRKLGAKKNYLIGFGHRTSHTAWREACELLSTPSSQSGYGSLSSDTPTFNDLYNGHPDPLQEDTAMFSRRALQVVENWEKERGASWAEEEERPWVRPSCDGMTIRVGSDGVTVGDDERSDELYKIKLEIANIRQALGTATKSEKDWIGGWLDGVESEFQVKQHEEGVEELSSNRLNGEFLTRSLAGVAQFLQRWQRGDPNLDEPVLFDPAVLLRNMKACDRLQGVIGAIYSRGVDLGFQEQDLTRWRAETAKAVRREIVQSSKDYADDEATSWKYHWINGKLLRLVTEMSDSRGLAQRFQRATLAAHSGPAILQAIKDEELRQSSQSTSQASSPSSAISYHSLARINSCYAAMAGVHTSGASLEGGRFFSRF